MLRIRVLVLIQLAIRYVCCADRPACLMVFLADDVVELSYFPDELKLVALKVCHHGIALAFGCVERQSVYASAIVCHCKISECEAMESI